MTIQATGTIQPAGVTTYQYGTHRLVDPTGHTLYALRSSVLDLNQYIGKYVQITGNKVPGYPLDGGPIYIDVQNIVFILATTPLH